MPRNDQQSSPATTRQRNPVSRIIGVIFALVSGFALILFWIYGTSTHHADRGSIWWTERGRNLIPPAATGITLQQDFLDHYATYTIKEASLNKFLNRRFADNGTPIDSFSDRSPVRADRIGTKIGRLGWVITENTVLYSYPASNGGMHDYYHDAETGFTYQESAYW